MLSTRRDGPPLGWRSSRGRGRALDDVRHVEERPLDRDRDDDELDEAGDPATNRRRSGLRNLRTFTTRWQAHGQHGGSPLPGTGTYNTMREALIQVGVLHRLSRKRRR
ncbi:hypothetical protein [Actinomadura oligospora]|uniref:hypothetical protein n=1 Tax=Actinomadura oligospora TaxID=111804 RepID=UPI00147599C3|nr:hypothetical protein [Actinomadura oligospora]